VRALVSSTQAAVGIGDQERREVRIVPAVLPAPALPVLGERGRDRFERGVGCAPALEAEPTRSITEETRWVGRRGSSTVQMSSFHRDAVFVETVLPRPTTTGV